jgi:hypothetical protein
MIGLMRLLHMHGHDMGVNSDLRSDGIGSDVAVDMYSSDLHAHMASYSIMDPLLIYRLGMRDGF